MGRAARGASIPSSPPGESRLQGRNGPGRRSARGTPATDDPRRGRRRSCHQAASLLGGWASRSDSPRRGRTATSISAHGIAPRASRRAIEWPGAELNRRHRDFQPRRTRDRGRLGPTGARTSRRPSWLLWGRVGPLSRTKHGQRRPPLRCVICVPPMERAGDRGRTGDVQLGKLSRPLRGKGFSAAVAETG